MRLSNAALAVAMAFTVAACAAEDTPDASDLFDPAAAASAVAEIPGDVANPEDSSDADDQAPTSTIEDAAQTPIDPLTIRGDIIQDTDLLDGDCFNRIEDLRAGRKVVITARTGCDVPHTYEVYYTFEIDAPRGHVYPGDRVMRDYARRSCYEYFEAFVGETYELSVYEIGVFTPDRANFEHAEAHYRVIHCWLYRTDNEQMTSSARDSGI